MNKKFSKFMKQFSGGKKKKAKLSSGMIILIVAVSVLGALLLIPYEINLKKEKGWEIKSLLLRVAFDKNEEGKKLTIRPFAG